MKKIKLVYPKLEDKIRAEEFKLEFFENGENIINGSALFDELSYEDWLNHLRKSASKDTVDEGWVPASTFFAVRKTDNKIVGIIDIRHELNDFLRAYGGHIGYAVSPNEREKGYATEMLQLALQYAKELGMKKVVLGCLQSNIPSQKTIEKCNGKVTSIKKYKGINMKLYEIDIIS